MNESQVNASLISLLLPEGILEFFEVTAVDQNIKGVIIHLDEKAIIPQEYEGLELQARGFTDARVLQDFPIRGKKVHLSIRRRRWAEKGNHKKLSRNWDIIAKGSRITAEFAAFLKEFD